MFRIRNCVGFSYISGHLCGDMILVRGKNTISVSLIWPLYYVMSRLWRSKNILGKILFEKSPGIATAVYDSGGQ